MSGLDALSITIGLTAVFYLYMAAGMILVQGRDRWQQLLGGGLAIVASFWLVAIAMFIVTKSVEGELQ